jgi:hypothetical protein
MVNFCGYAHILCTVENSRIDEQDCELPERRSLKVCNEPANTKASERIEDVKGYF